MPSRHRLSSNILRLLVIGVVLLIGAVGVVWSVTRTDTTANVQQPAEEIVARPSDADTALSTLVVREPRTGGYSRALFGEAWADVDNNGCDTRNDILARDLQDKMIRSDGCTIESGVLRDPYTGRSISFQRGKDTSSQVQIDHVVALSNAWQSGASSWDGAKRLAFANDPLELLAVEGRANQDKSDADASKWLPPNVDYRCEYAARQIAVKVKYQLSVTAAEKSALTNTLAACPGQSLPIG